MVVEVAHGFATTFVVGVTATMLLGVTGVRLGDDVSKYHPSLLLLLLWSRKAVVHQVQPCVSIILVFCKQPVHSPVPSLARLKPFEGGDDDDDGLDKDLWVVLEKGSVCTFRDCTYRDAVSYGIRGRVYWLGENGNEHSDLCHNNRCSCQLYCRHTRFSRQSTARHPGVHTIPCTAASIHILDTHGFPVSCICPHKKNIWTFGQARIASRRHYHSNCTHTHNGGEKKGMVFHHHQLEKV